MTWWTSERYPCADGSPAAGRRFCTRNLGAMLRGRPGAVNLIADAEIIVSELLTNAVNANCSGTELTLSGRDDSVRIEVHDDGAGTPELRHPAVDDRNGRGLLIVSALSSDWGVEPSAHGKRVWAELALTG